MIVTGLAVILQRHYEGNVSSGKREIFFFDIGLLIGTGMGE